MNCPLGRDPLGWYDPLRRLIRAIENHRAPVIAMIEGGVWGGVCEAAMACDIIVAAPNATFALTPAKLGVPYNVSGMLTFLNSGLIRMIKEMAFTGRPISAERALAGGLINHLVPLEELETFTYGYQAGDIVANAPLSIAVMKEELAHPRRRASHEPAGLPGERQQGLRRIKPTTAPITSRALPRSRKAQAGVSRGVAILQGPYRRSEPRAALADAAASRWNILGSSSAFIVSFDFLAFSCGGRQWWVFYGA